MAATRSGEDPGGLQLGSAAPTPRVPAGPQTTHAGRSLVDRLAPVAVLIFGLVFVAIAITRLDDIYDGDPGIFRSGQLAPAPVAAARDVRKALRELRDLGTQSDFAKGPCAKALLADPCKPTLAGRSADYQQRLAAMEASGRGLVGGSGETTDIEVVHWDDGRDAIVAVAVARFSSPAAAARALTTSRTRGDDTVAGHPLARTTWRAGKRVLVGVLASADEPATAAHQLAVSNRQTSAYVGVARSVWFELLALGPLLILFIALGTARFITVLAIALVVSVVALAALAIVIPILVVVVSWLLLSRRRRRAVRDLKGAVAAPVAAAPVEGPMVLQRDIAVPGVMTVEHDRDAFLAVIVLIGFAIAVFTTSLFPASLAWGSLALAAIGRPPEWARGLRRVATIHRALLWTLAIAIVALLTGLTPPILSDTRLLVVLAPLGLAVLLGRWRELTAGTDLAYTKWYEDVDGRSTLFLLGAAVLMLGAGSLFLASTGSVDLRAQLGEKAFAIVGLAVALQSADNVRGSRDAARRDRARERGTAPVLYLRSFGDDSLMVKSPRSQRGGLERMSLRGKELFEDVVAGALSRIGPVVAIAKPGTGQRDLGPARDSIVTSDWLGGVKAYMGDAVLVTVVVGSSGGLVRELETLGELGLLDRLCIFVPPVADEEVARRLAVLGRQRGYSNTWGPLHDDDKRRIVALISIDGQRSVVTAKKRTAYGYRKCVADIQVEQAGHVAVEAETEGRGA
ncbi:MAG: hypothetical protein ABR511_09460 [Acidimicrobiales bacterium]